jgi:hypothetical protein
MPGDDASTSLSEDSSHEHWNVLGYIDYTAKFIKYCYSRGWSTFPKWPVNFYTYGIG